MSFEIVFRGPGIKDLDPNGNPIKREPLFPHIEKPGVVTRSGDVGVDLASGVMTDIFANLSSAPRSLKTLAVTYLRTLEIPKLAVLAAFMYENQMIDQPEMLKLLSEAVLNNRSEILSLESMNGKGEDGRLTLGGVFKPGIKIGTLDDLNVDFVVSAVAETFQMATRESGADSDLTKIFPKYAPLPVVKADSPLTVHTLNLKRDGFCGCPGCRDSNGFF